jgi:hypothetical protein
MKKKNFSVFAKFINLAGFHRIYDVLKKHKKVNKEVKPYDIGVCSFDVYMNVYY